MNDGWQETLQRRIQKERTARRILGVDESADAVEIKQAFWLLAMQYHPDRGSRDPEDRKRFANIVNAYEFIVKGRENGWNPEGTDAPEEERIGEYLANDWGYFCWWRDNFESGSNAPPRLEPKRKPEKDEPESSEPGGWF